MRRNRSEAASARSAGQGRRPTRLGSVLIAIGVVLVAAAIALSAYNWWDSNRAGSAASNIEQQLEGASDNSSSSGSTSDSMTVDGVQYLGTLEIPSLNIKLPVAREWSYEQLNISPARYSGSYSTNDLVICAHNYATHFGPIENVDIGADVYFTPVGGQRIHYVVGNRETLEPTAIQQMVENDNNSDRKDKWDMTLFTCTLDGQARVSVRCLRTS
jgi:sortase A